MTNYRLDLSPLAVNPSSEGSLDPAILNGNSIQREAWLEVVDGSDRKIIKVSDGATFNNSFSTSPYSCDVIASEPVVTTDNLTVSGQSCHVYGTVVSEGTSDVTEYGFVYAANTENPTTANHKVVVDTGSFTGEFDDVVNVSSSVDGFDMNSGDNPVWFAAYATNSVGTSYGSVLQTSPNPWLCLIEGTMIAMADGSYKEIENIGYDDTLLVWNFDEARLDNAKPIWIMKSFEANRYSLVSFSNGAELGTIDDGKGHSIFNVEEGRFTHMMSEDTPVGTTTYTKNGNKIKVLNKKIIREKTTFYNVVTNFHMNVFANNILTSTGLNNLYPIANMKFIKEDTNTINNIEGITVEMAAGLRLAEQSTDCREKVLRMQRRQV